jgi:phage terminase Nu1 subunit (DNA packaging protein)
MPETKRAKPGPKPAIEPEGYTVARFAQLAGFDRHTIGARIEEMKIQPVGKTVAQAAALYAIRDLVRAILGGDIEAEKLRKTREEADKLALANARSRGELVEIASVKKLGEKIMVAIRNRLLNMPLTDEEKDRCLKELLDLGKLDWSREG